jgi:uncharacterized protein YuzB (UPF0349 family)
MKLTTQFGLCLTFTSWAAGCNSAFQSHRAEQRMWKLDEVSVVKIRCETHSDFCKPASERTTVRSSVQVVSADGLTPEIDFVSWSNGDVCLFDLKSLSVCTDANRRMIWLVDSDGVPRQFALVRGERVTGKPADSPRPKYDRASAILLEPIP